MQSTGGRIKTDAKSSGLAMDSRRIHKPLLEYKRVPGRTTPHELLAMFQEVLTVLDGLGVKVLSAIADNASKMKAFAQPLLLGGNSKSACCWLKGHFDCAAPQDEVGIPEPHAKHGDSKSGGH